MRRLELLHPSEQQPHESLVLSDDRHFDGSGIVVLDSPSVLATVEACAVHSPVDLSQLLCDKLEAPSRRGQRQRHPTVPIAQERRPRIFTPNQTSFL